jgi:Domain of unknown function (DUF4349)/Putative zinc-finger
MSSTTHPIAPEEIMAFLDGQLSAEHAQSVSAHMEGCSDCRTLTQQLQSTTQSLSSWKVEALSSAIGDRVLSAAANIPTAAKSFSSAIFHRTKLWTWKHWAGGLAATASLAMLLFSIAIPNLLRSKMAANEASAIGRSHADQTTRTMSVDNSKVTNKDDLPDAFDNGSLAKLQSSIDNAATDKLLARAKPEGTLAGSIGDHAQNLFSNHIADQQSRTFSGPMIARTVSLAIIVKNFDTARASLDSVLARHNGYSANLSVSTPQEAARSLQASLRIPALQLSVALAELKALGHVENEAQSGEEVTQQHADLVARLKNSRETEQRLQAILVQRTGKISDVLSVEQEIARVRGEIEQMEAEQKNVERRVDFATIDLKLAEEYKARLGSPATSVSTQLHNAMVTGYKSAAESLLGLVLFFAEYGQVLILWFVILAMPAWLVWRRWQRAAASF